MIHAMAVSVGTSPTRLDIDSWGADSICISNQSGPRLFIGDSSVSPSNGFPVEANQSVSISNINDPVYGVVASGSANVNILQVGQ